MTYQDFMEKSQSLLIKRLIYLDQINEVLLV